MFKFEKLEVWHKSIKLAKTIFEICNNLPQKYQYSLGDQLKRAVISISANIAEASGRKNIKESSNLYNISKGSVYEVVSLIKILNEENLINQNQYDEIYNNCEEIAKMLTGLIKFKNHD